MLCIVNDSATLTKDNNWIFYYNNTGGRALGLVN